MCEIAEKQHEIFGQLVFAAHCFPLRGGNVSVKMFFVDAVVHDVDQLLIDMKPAHDPFFLVVGNSNYGIASWGDKWHDPPAIMISEFLIEAVFLRDRVHKDDIVQRLYDRHGGEIWCRVSSAMQDIDMFAAGCDGQKKLFEIRKKKSVHVPDLEAIGMKKAVLILVILGEDNKLMTGFYFLQGLDQFQRRRFNAELFFSE